MPNLYVCLARYLLTFLAVIQLVACTDPLRDSIRPCIARIGPPIWGSNAAVQNDVTAKVVAHYDELATARGDMQAAKKAGAFGFESLDDGQRRMAYERFVECLDQKQSP